MQAQVIYLQNSVHLAGAQKSLSRVLAAPAIKAFQPILVTSKKGWLTGFAQEKGVAVCSKTFPKSRSLVGRLYGNRIFATEMADILAEHLLENRLKIIHVNDHPDSIHGYRLAQAIGGVSILTLRTPGMTQRDFFKYGCHRHKVIISVGDKLFEKVQKWYPQGNHVKVYNGVQADEFSESCCGDNKSPPGAVLVLGSVNSRKGWQDVIHALTRIEQSGGIIHYPEITFLGDQYGKDPRAVFDVAGVKKFRLRFLKPVENYAQHIRGFPLVIHPSRSESFGMSALETIAAGVPLLAADTGMISKFLVNQDFLFPPGDIKSLANGLKRYLMQDQSLTSMEFQVKQCQERVRREFSLEATVSTLSNLYCGLAN